MNKLDIEYKRRGVFLRKRTGMPAINAGGAIVIIIFVVLCLTIFGLLSFATAFADRALADRTLESARQFYAADKQAERELAEIFTRVYNNIGGQSWETELDGRPATLVRFETPINGARAIASEIALYLADGRLNYRILRRSVIITIDLDHGEQGLDIWDGGFFEFD